MSMGNEEAAKSLRQLISVYDEHSVMHEALRMGAEALLSLDVIPYEAISITVNDAMSSAVERGANSVSMPDDYVAVAAWLCGITPQPKGDSDER